VACATEIPNEPIFLDVPENNRAALELVARYRMREVFGCARMVIGHVPQLSDAEIFGVTTFELG
jgi:GNAT acetyltransferase-like protein